MGDHVSDRPKRRHVISAYETWLDEHLEQITEDNPGCSSLEVKSIAAQLWHRLKDTSEWDQQAAQANDEMKKLKKNYTAFGSANGRANGRAIGLGLGRRGPSC